MILPKTDTIKPAVGDGTVEPPLHGSTKPELEEGNATNRRGYCIYINMLCQGPVPCVSESLPTDPCNSPEKYCVFDTELEAQREIIDFMMMRLQAFLDGERDFEDAITVEEYVVAVEVLPDGTIMDANGNCFSGGLLV